MDKKRKISNTNTNSNQKKFPKVVPMTVFEKTNSFPIGDNFIGFKSSFDKGFFGYEKSIPKYYQALAEIQLEYIQCYENFFNLIAPFQRSVMGKLEIETIQFEKINEINSKVIEILFKINSLKFESLILSLESLVNISRDWNSLFLSYSNTFQKILSYKNK